MAAMNVLFDSHAFCLQRYGGISRYVCELAAHLAREPGVDVSIAAAVHRNALLARMSENAGVTVTGRYLPWPQVFYGPMVLANVVHAAQHAPAAQIVHETYYPAFAAPPRRARHVITVHDMIHEILPRQFSKADGTSWRKRRAVARADRVICVSHSTRDDLIERLGVSERRIEVVHHGWSLPAPDPRTVTAAAASRPFLLFVGARAGYKNFDRLVEVYAASSRLRSELSVVCFGGGSLTASEVSSLRSHGLAADDVRHAHGDDSVLAGLYAQAVALVYPSLYEGFGIPMLEAMGTGCPVAASNTSAMPEIAGGAAVLFDPGDTDAMRSALEQVVFDASTRARLVRDGLARAGVFSWQRCATETLAVYRSLV